MSELHYHDKLTDYVLGILDASDAAAIERHAIECDACRRIIVDERRFMSEIRRTISATAQPSRAQIARVAPRIDAVVPRSAAPAVWRRAAAVAAIVLFLLIGNFGIQQFTTGVVEASPAPTALVATATATAEPTATATRIASSAIETAMTPLTVVTPAVSKQPQR